MNNSPFISRYGEAAVLGGAGSPGMLGWWSVANGPVAWGNEVLAEAIQARRSVREGRVLLKAMNRRGVENLFY